MLSDVSVLFVVVLIGYALVSQLNTYRPRLQGLSNYAVLFECAIVGGLIFVTVWAVLRAIGDVLANFSLDESYLASRNFVMHYLPFPQSDVLLVSAAVALLTIRIGNSRREKDEVRERIARASGLIPQLLLDAVNERCLVQVTTARRKVYVGWIWMGPSITERGQISDVAILPMVSGYRDRETQEVHLVTDYKGAIKRYIHDPIERNLLSAEQLETRRREMSVVIPTIEITLIRRFIENLSAQFDD